MVVESSDDEITEGKESQRNEDDEDDEEEMEESFEIPKTKGVWLRASTTNSIP